ncbi:GFA family protein [Actibacterium pelagium]|uniref:GFA family protein n=1 Tax=Actibacterium pelagium TaxID=2029103 RepID=UPI001E2C4571|nr:GFA family protein [Actibacterium pelagium]
MAQFETCEGGCTCGHVRYQVISEPMIVHCCHCSWCQRQSGSAFAVNALIEADRVKLISGAVEEVTVPSPSGKGQTIARCPICRVAVWSNYYMGGLKDRIRFLRVGSLDDPNLMPPDVHIFTSTKQDWVILPPKDKSAKVFYDVDATWSPESLKRLDALDAAAGIEQPWRYLRRTVE